jgi:cyclase
MPQAEAYATERSMTELYKPGVGPVSRREAIGRVAAAGLGALSMLRGIPLNAQSSAGPVTTPPLDRNFPVPAAWPTELKKLAPNVYTYIQAGGPGLGSGAGVSNAGIIVGDEHLMVIDTLGQPIMVNDLKTRVRNAVGNKPYGRVIDTHQHADHVGGNQFFMPAEIVGHTFCRETVLTMAAALPPGAKFDKREGWADGTEDKKLIAPGTTFSDKMTYYYGKTPVELIHPGVAHTWGDLMVYLPEYKILFAADVAFFRITPFTHQGHVSQWIDVIDKVMAMDVDTIIPGHGPVGGKKELAEMRDYFVILKREARKRFDAGMSPGKAAADIKMGKFDNWFGSERNLLNTFRLYCEFDGTITPMLDLPRMARATEEYNAILKARA